MTSSPASPLWFLVTLWAVGEVLRADIMRNRDNTSKGVGTVLMATEEGAEAAIAALDNTDLGGRSIAVQLDKYA